MTIIDKITIYSNDVNKTLPSIQLLTMNTLHYFVIKKVNNSLGITSMARLKSCTKWIDIMPMRIHTNFHELLHFYSFL